ncbi:hypothetical protein [Paracoccus cavernae]|uniref:hypothetical protein n=1 Tax=Paracoccus cavernae TaxID=1571207 RepID=UPI0035F42763
MNAKSKLAATSFARTAGVAKTDPPQRIKQYIIPELCGKPARLVNGRNQGERRRRRKLPIECGLCLRRRVPLGKDRHPAHIIFRLCREGHGLKPAPRRVLVKPFGNNRLTKSFPRADCLNGPVLFFRKAAIFLAIQLQAV